MPNPSTNELLSFGDALFLYLEREGVPINVASVAIFDGEIALEQLVPYLDAKRERIPRFRQRVVSPPFNVGLPSWENDPSFDVHNHVHALTLKKGTEAELKEVASRVLSTTLDRRHPLWHITLVRGLKANRSAIIVRVHHALADGISGVGILHELLDATPDVPRLPKRKLRAPEAPPQRDPVSLMVEGIVGTCMYAAQRAMEAQGQMLKVAQQIVAGMSGAAENPGAMNGGGGGASAFDQISQLLPELAAATYRLPFNKTICHGPQNFRWAHVPLADIKAVKNACGVTVNDVILSIITSAIRRYAIKHNAQIDGRLVRIVVPVNVRGDGDVADLGNEITFIPASIPLDIPEGRELIQAVHDRMMFLKVARIGELVGIAASIFGAIPTPVQAFLGPIASQLPISACNTICTNVPGPQHPLYLLGHKMAAIYPYVPIGGEMGMNCAVLTYDGMAYFGFIGDAGATPDVECFEKFVGESFAEICKAMGVRPQSKTASRKKAAPAAKSRKKTVAVAAGVAHKRIRRQKPAPPVVAEEVAPADVVTEEAAPADDVTHEGAQSESHESQPQPRAFTARA